jgi:hypothetical protein
MSVTPEFVKKELVKLEKKRQANETSRKEALESLDKAESIKLNLQQEEVALRTLAAGKIPKDARVTIAQQLAEALKVKYDESSIMDLITKYEKQDTATEPAKPAASSKPAAPKVTTPPAPESDSTEAPKKQRGRPALTPEQKAERAKQRAIAAAAAAAVPEVDESDVDMDDEMEDEFPDLDEYGDE